MDAYCRTHLGRTTIGRTVGRTVQEKRAISWAPVLDAFHRHHRYHPTPTARLRSAASVDACDGRNQLTDATASRPREVERSTGLIPSEDIKSDKEIVWERCEGGKSEGRMRGCPRVGTGRFYIDTTSKVLTPDLSLSTGLRAMGFPPRHPR